MRLGECWFLGYFTRLLKASRLDVLLKVLIPHLLLEPPLLFEPPGLLLGELQLFPLLLHSQLLFLLPLPLRDIFLLPAPIKVEHPTSRPNLHLKSLVFRNRLVFIHITIRNGLFVS